VIIGLRVQNVALPRGSTKTDDDTELQMQKYVCQDLVREGARN